MTKEEHAKVLDALEAITKHFSISRLHESTLADTTVRGQAHEAIAIMRKEPQGWMPIETAPKDGKMILLHCDHGNFKYISCGNWVNHRGGYWTTDFAESVTPEELMAMQPTHWMPLPPPPALLEKAR